MSSQGEDRQSDYPPWRGEPAAPDILEQGSDRPSARWWPAVRWRRPPAVAIVLGVAGLLGGLVAGYAAGTLHAEKAAATAPQSGAAAAPAKLSPVAIGRAPSHFQPLCSGQAGATGMHLQLDTPATNASLAPTGQGTVIVMVPSPWGPLRLTCRR